MQCKSCPRLAKYIRDVGKIKTKQYMDQDYWAKPVPTFGDPKAKLLVVGLAPAANGEIELGEYSQGIAPVIGL
jgi:uracil-DNA glycosylase